MVAPFSHVEVRDTGHRGSVSRAAIPETVWMKLDQARDVGCDGFVVDTPIRVKKR